MQVVVTLFILAALTLLTLSAITRQAAGEPLLPPRVMHALHRHQPTLPPGINYEIDALDPVTLRPLSELPQLGAVQLRLALTNDSALPITLVFPTSTQCEFIVRKVHTYLGGLFVLPLEVWRSSYFHNLSHRQSVLTLRPGQTKVYVTNWTLNVLNSQELSPGDYQLTAAFRGVNLPLRLEKPL